MDKKVTIYSIPVSHFLIIVFNLLFLTTLKVAATQVIMEKADLNFELKIVNCSDSYDCIPDFKFCDMVVNKCTNCDSSQGQYWEWEESMCRELCPAPSWWDGNDCQSEDHTNYGDAAHWVIWLVIGSTIVIWTGLSSGIALCCVRCRLCPFYRIRVRDIEIVGTPHLPASASIAELPIVITDTVAVTERASALIRNRPTSEIPITIDDEETETGKDVSHDFVDILLNRNYVFNSMKSKLASLQFPSLYHHYR